MIIIFIALKTFQNDFVLKQLLIKMNTLNINTLMVNVLEFKKLN